MTQQELRKLLTRHALGFARCPSRPLQVPQCLANRSLAYPKLARKASFHDAFSRLQMTLEDVLHQPFANLFPKHPSAQKPAWSGCAFFFFRGFHWEMVL